jgi:hypothetical protein
MKLNWSDESKYLFDEPGHASQPQTDWKYFWQPNSGLESLIRILASIKSKMARPLPKHFQFRAIWPTDQYAHPLLVSMDNALPVVI